MEPRVDFATAADGVRIAWTSIGTGPTLLSLPGVPLSNVEAEWRIPVMQRAFDRFAGRIRFIQFDGRGTGRSQRDVSDVGLEAHLRDIDAVVEAANVDEVVLLGFYHSSTHAIAWAARHPTSVRGVVLFGGALRGWDAMSGAATQALLSLIERDWDTFAESAVHAWLGWPRDEEGRLAAEWFRTATSPAVARATLEAASTVDVSAEASLVQCPVLVLHRDRATVIPLSVSQGIVAAVPDGRLEIILGQSASLYFEAGDVVVDRLTAFTIDPGGPPPVGAPTRSRSIDAVGGGLSARETDVLRLVAGGETNGQIAARLGITINTVERHVTNIYRKLDARGRADATAWAVRNGLG